MSGLVWLWPIVVVLLAFLVALRPGWTWGALYVLALLASEQAGLSPLPALCAVTGAWLLWQGARLVRRAS